jgi:hypothetical protein
MRKLLLTAALTVASGCGSPALTDDEDGDALTIAQDVCELMPTCVSSLVTVEECVEIQLGCRDLDEPGAWNEHMLDCVELGGCEEGDSGLVGCVAAAPRMAECEGGGRP